jgi:hypothetical protein
MLLEQGDAVPRARQALTGVQARWPAADDRRIELSHGGLC